MLSENTQGKYIKLKLPLYVLTLGYVIDLTKILAINLAFQNQVQLARVVAIVVTMSRDTHRPTNPGQQLNAVAIHALEKFLVGQVKLQSLKILQRQILEIQLMRLTAILGMVR